MCETLCGKGLGRIGTGGLNLSFMLNGQDVCQIKDHNVYLIYMGMLTLMSGSGPNEGPRNQPELYVHMSGMLWRQIWARGNYLVFTFSCPCVREILFVFIPPVEIQRFKSVLHLYLWQRVSWCDDGCAYAAWGVDDLMRVLWSCFSGMETGRETEMDTQ